MMRTNPMKAEIPDTMTNVGEFVRKTIPDPNNAATISGIH